MMTDDEIIAVVQAHKEGKTIQCRYLSDDAVFGRWHCGIWQFDAFEYRVAPEPRKPREWIVLVRDGNIYSRFEGIVPKSEFITVREVI